METAHAPLFHSKCNIFVSSGFGMDLSGTWQILPECIRTDSVAEHNKSWTNFIQSIYSSGDSEGIKDTKNVRLENL